MNTKICDYRNCENQIGEDKRKDAKFCCSNCKKMEQTYRKRKKVMIENKELKDNIKKEKDKINKLKNNIRNLIKNTFYYNGFTKKTKTYKILGCTYNEFIQHMEDKFEPWMNWENYGKYNGEFDYGWDIDHIIPVSKAKTEEEIFELNHYTNLQPMCSKVNRHIKRSKLNYN
jgi:hypothetical protein